jgi:hypothetical protein
MLHHSKAFEARFGRSEHQLMPNSYIRLIILLLYCRERRSNRLLGTSLGLSTERSILVGNIMAIELRNDSPNKFVDISTEMFREYNFGQKGFVRVDRPQWLSAGPNGHRVLDIEGISHYIPSGWIHIKWQANGNLPHFVK